MVRSYVVAHWHGLLDLRWAGLLSALPGLILYFLLVFVIVLVGSIPVESVLGTLLSVWLLWFVVGLVRSSFRVLRRRPLKVVTLFGAVAALGFVALLAVAIVRDLLRLLYP